MIMVDLGKYAGTVLWSYGITLPLLAVVVAVYLRRNAASKAALKAMEDKDA